MPHVQASRPLKVGLYIPNGEGVMGAGTPRWKDVLRKACTAEDAGFDSIWVADHFIFRFPDSEPMGRWECWSLLSALAAATTRVELGPLVNCMSFRNPALLAKIAETVDEISDGRLNLLVGAGWHQPEYDAYGFPFDHRVSRFEEGFHIVRGLLNDGQVTYTGQFERAVNCELRPRGPRPGGIPLIIGSNGPRMLRLMAEYADGWNTTWLTDPAEMDALNLQVDAACDEVGRDPGSLSRSACIFVDLPSRAGRGVPTNQNLPATCDPAQLAELLAQYAGKGLDHVMLWIDPNTEAGIEEVGRALEILDT
jgi:alkanesulfonate monooxygenase SsuD/methylene tetrahydromethanopterin reductase-like flavin-dependent oxidoreductase (luciferase family)